MRKGETIVNDSMMSHEERAEELNKRLPMLNKIIARNGGSRSATRRDKSERNADKINNFKTAADDNKSKSPTVHERLYN